MDEMKLRAELEAHLDTLRRNLEVVSMEELKTKYKKPFEELRDNICRAATDYTRQVALHDIRIRTKYMDEAQNYLNASVQNSGCLKKISQAAFQRQDIQEIEALALSLRSEILQALHYFYLNHMCLFISPECKATPGQAPEIYNEAASCIWRDGVWQQMEDTSLGTLVFAESIHELPPGESAA